MNHSLSLENVDIDKVDKMSIEFNNHYNDLDRSLHSKSSEFYLRRLCVKHYLSEHETNWALLWYRSTYKTNKPSI